MSRKVTFASYECYHLYNRGTEKREIFLDEEDHKRFILLLYFCNSTLNVNLWEDVMKKRDHEDAFKHERGDQLIDIGAYCLMPNHFHLLIRERVKNGTSRFMQKLSSGYTVYFNKKYKRTGALFEGRFKAKHVDQDNYFQYLYAYIHLNPVKMIEPDWKAEGIKDIKKVERYLEEYKFSSYLDYLGERRECAAVLNRGEYPKEFNDTVQLRDFLKAWQRQV